MFQSDVDCVCSEFFGFSDALTMLRVSVIEIRFLAFSSVRTGVIWRQRWRGMMSKILKRKIREQISMVSALLWRGHFVTVFIHPRDECRSLVPIVVFWQELWSVSVRVFHVANEKDLPFWLPLHTLDFSASTKYFRHVAWTGRSSLPDKNIIWARFQPTKW